MDPFYNNNNEAFAFEYACQAPGPGRGYNIEAISARAAADKKVCTFRDGAKNPSQLQVEATPARNSIAEKLFGVIVQLIVLEVHLSEDTYPPSSQNQCR